MLTEFAPAKVNLYLHVTGRQPDGYHQLDSLVAFAGIGDELRLEPADNKFSFCLKGPYAAALADEAPEKNLVVQAARSLSELTGKTLTLTLTLIKNLPVASGIGGGSSDAAAALRLLARHWGLAPDDARLMQAAARHGQDVPVCLLGAANYMTATGVVLASHGLPQAGIVLVNSDKALPTPDVFRDYRNSGQGFSTHAQLGQTPATAADLALLLKQRTNDLYPSACRLLPEIGNIIASLDATSGCLLARMSGSGATCFGLFADQDQAIKAAAGLAMAYPDWWIKSGVVPVPQS